MQLPESSLNNTIHRAARDGNLIRLQQLLAEGVSIESYDESGYTPLMVACVSPHAGGRTVEYLLAQGADVHALVKTAPRGKPSLDNPDVTSAWETVEQTMEEMFQEEGFDPGMLEMMKLFIQKAEACEPEPQPVIALAVQKAEPEVVRTLIAHGADAKFVTPAGYNLVTYAIGARQMKTLDLLLDAGAPIDGITSHGESAVRIASREGRFDLTRKLLARGADPTPLQWTPLMHAVAVGTLEDVRRQLDLGGDLEARDYWERTAFLLSLDTGEIEKSAMLLAEGADRQALGRCGKPAVHHPISQDDVPTLRWLLDQGFGLAQTDQFGTTALSMAASGSSLGCFQLLLEAGADWRKPDQHGERVIRNASHPEIIGMLVDRGEDIGAMEPEHLRNYIGLGNSEDLPIDGSQYHEGRSRRFGTSNPEVMRIPFWHAMVRSGIDAYRGGQHFADSSYGRDNPIWCHQRFGMTTTALPDGRFVQIAGEHEDHYDPDFCIYNEVIVHDGKGGFEIFGYPEEVFPPTDFHSATLVGDWIYVIGNLGYYHNRGTETSMYRLHIPTWKMESVATKGLSPGWIFEHQAKLRGNLIMIEGGKIFRTKSDGTPETVDNPDRHAFNLATQSWQSL